MKSVKVQDLTPGDEVRGIVHVCKQCGAVFIARRDAQTCSNACRVKHKRRAEKETGQ